MVGRLPTDTELLINERIMGRCNHPEHITETRLDDQIEWRYLICTRCGKEVFDPAHAFMGQRKKPKDYLKKFVQRYSQDIAIARTVVWQLAGMGWASYLSRENGKFRYYFDNGSVIAHGELADSEQEAICSAAIKLVIENLIQPNPTDFQAEPVLLCPIDGNDTYPALSFPKHSQKAET